MTAPAQVLSPAAAPVVLPARRRWPFDRVALAAIVATGVALRAFSGLHTGSLRDVREYDDGVHYAAGLALSHGLVPYRDFVLLHPPGIALLIAPFAFLGDAVGQADAMAVARVAILLVSAVNMLLVARLCGADSRRAGVVAALAYAIAPGTVAAEHTVMLEPLINLACLAAAIRLRNKRAGAAGALVGLAICLKLFPITFAIAAAVSLRHEPPALRRFLAALATALACVAGPFFVLAPAAMWHQVVLVQAIRPPAGVVQVTTRLLDLAPVLLATMAVLVRPSWVRRQSAASSVWICTAALTSMAFLAGSSFFSHYLAYLAPCFAVLVAAAAAADASSHVVKAVAGVAVAVAALSSWHTMHDRVDVPPPPAAATAPRGCTIAENPSLLVALNSLAPPTPACPQPVDPRGSALATARALPRDFYPYGFRALATTQDQLAVALRRAQTYVATTPLASDPMLDADNRAYINRCFRLTAADAPWNIWTRRSC